MKKGKETTIYDIAKQLNISASTVSRALQDHPGVNKKTKKMIADFVAQTSFRTNPFASNLRNKQTKTIGVLVHELNSNFITSVLAGIEKVTASEGYDIIIAHSSESFHKEAANVKNLFNKRVDGLIASLSFDTSNLEHFKPFFERGVPVLFFDRVEQDGNKTVVIIDNAKCGYIATQHLIEQGCRRIVHVTSSLNRNVYSQRYKGYRDALFDHGLPFEESMLMVEDLSKKAGVSAANKIMNSKPMPDGAFITNDFLAAVCIRTLKENGIAVPKDIAIVGFNNDAIGELIDPTLTTINYPGEDMGEIAARNLINHINGIGNLEQTNTIIVRSGLVVRNSSLRTP
ncbi:transcriptional regulator, LacI family [Filimonas lacunae]|uniref:Transcriptional regulator, LacI family n=1 Tax=Filimonas lacunae TaxID=477680 RepID=A0A173MGM3_9BACT|nr:LacI family DNA-binding transcriptional regulator [Filimonas lacunae]BAV06753.1 LacI family transcriptional regulator [Filimonas lacunae]SIT34407.1 transcriptional regulator, LacI family [Filimonas lacunae]